MKPIQLFFLFFSYTVNLLAQVPSSGLRLWFKTDKGIIVSENNVLSWKDQSANHNSAVTKTSAYPQLIPAGLNGYPVIRFNGLNNGMETYPVVNFPAKRGSIFIVAKINGRSATSGVGVSNFIATFHGRGITWQFCATPLTYSYYDGTASEGLPVSQTSPTNWNIITLLRSSDTTMTIFTGGRFEKHFTVINTQPDTNTLKIGFNGRIGGSATDSIPEVLNGDIAEIIIYDRALNSDELNIIHNYLSKKYALELRPPPYYERWWFYGLIILFMLFLYIMVNLFLSQRKLKSRLAELEKHRQMDKERHRISREMHDDIGAGLTQITMMSESVKSKVGNSSEKELDDIAETSRKLVSSINEIIWSLNPENKTLEQLVAYLREQLDKQLEYTGKAYSLLFPENGMGIILSNEQRRNILLATKEIVNNAIKHSNAENISVKMVIDKNDLYCMVEDDGTGFDITGIYAGNGLKNIKYRIEELGGKLEINTGKGEGSRFNYSIPL